MTPSKKPGASRSRPARPAAGADVYRQQIIDHYRTPRNFGALPGCDARCRESNFSCGDDLEFFLKVKGGIIREVKFQGHGCALSVAAASLLTDHLTDQPVEQVAAMTEQDVLDLLKLGPLSGSRLRCATLGLKAVQSAIAAWLADADAASKPAAKKPRGSRKSPKK